MMRFLRRTASAVVEFLRAEKPEAVVLALAVVAAGVAAAVCLPRGFERNGIQVPAAAAWGIMGVGVLIAALAALRPWPALLAWILFMPFFTAARIGPTVGWVQVTSSTVILATLLCACLLGFRRSRPTIAKLPLALGGVMVLLAALSTAVSPDLSNGVTITIHGIVEPVGIAVFLILVRPGLQKLLALTVAMSASVAIAGVVNLARMVALVHRLSDFESLRGELGRITYYNVGLFGGMLVLTIPLIALLVARPDLPAAAAERAAQAAARLIGRTTAPWSIKTTARVSALIRIKALVVIGFMLVLIALTFSKSAYIAAFVLGAGVILLMARTWRLRAVGLGAIVVVAGFFVLVSVVTTAPTSDRNNSFNPTSTEGEMSVTERFLATKAALRMAVDNPIVGVGPGLFSVEYAGPYRDPQATTVLQSAHDMVPNIAAEYGLPLAIIFSLTILAALWAALRLTLSGAGLARLLAIAFGLSLVGFMIIATLFGTDLYRAYRYMNTDMLYLGLLLGAIYVLVTTAVTPDADAAA
jgi:O-antigen ligase